MAGIFQGDILIKTAIELGMEDMRKNPWLIDYMLSDLVSISYLADKYGQKQIDSCKEWFLNNQIDIYMGVISEKDRPPCITISMGPAPEKEDMKHMADQSTESIVLMPNQIGKPIPYVVKPFDIESYDSDTGLVSISEQPTNMDGVSEGMILVDPVSGNGYKILSVEPNGVEIESSLTLTATKFGIIPANAFYKARVEHAFFQGSYNIGCHAHGDPQSAIWLHDIVLTALLRYRESLFECNGFTQSTVSSGALEEDSVYTGAGGEQGFVRRITLSGMIENSWVKSPRRFIETVNFKNPKNFSGGIKIQSNLDTSVALDETNEPWTTVEVDEE